MSLAALSSHHHRFFSIRNRCSAAPSGGGGGGIIPGGDSGGAGGAGASNISLPSNLPAILGGVAGAIVVAAIGAWAWRRYKASAANDHILLDNSASGLNSNLVNSQYAPPRMV
jgi:hypothetical protein